MTDQLNRKALFLVENGFCERELQQSQNAVRKLGIFCRIISASETIVTAWNEEKEQNASNWGSQYAVDAAIDKCVPSEFDVLIIPGGERSVNKLKNHPELRTLIASFVNTKKPIVAFNLGIDLINFVGMAKGYSMATKADLCDTVKKSGGRCAPENLVVSKNLITLSRYREESEAKLVNALDAVLKNEPYIEKVASSGDLPSSYQAA